MKLAHASVNMWVWHSWGPFITQSISCTHLLLFLGLPHWAVVFLLVEDFFHFTVLQVVQFSDCILRPLDQIDEDLWRTISPHELMLGRTKGDREEICEMNNCFCNFKQIIRAISGDEMNKQLLRVNTLISQISTSDSVFYSIYEECIRERKVCILFGLVFTWNMNGIHLIKANISGETFGG